MTVLISPTPNLGD